MYGPFFWATIGKKEREKYETLAENTRLAYRSGILVAPEMVNDEIQMKEYARRGKIEMEMTNQVPFEGCHVFTEEILGQDCQIVEEEQQVTDQGCQVLMEDNSQLELDQILEEKQQWGVDQDCQIFTEEIPQTVEMDQCQIFKEEIPQMAKMDQGCQIVDVKQPMDYQDCQVFVEELSEISHAVEETRQDVVQGCQAPELSALGHSSVL